jgi:hypothetical protein
VRPENVVDAQHPVIGAISARDTGGDEAGVLEEVEMKPGHHLPIVRLARTAARWAGETGARFGGHGEMQFIGPCVGLQALIDDRQGGVRPRGLAPGSPPSRTLRAVPGRGGLRPSLTAAARGAARGSIKPERGPRRRSRMSRDIATVGWLCRVRRRASFVKDEIPIEQCFDPVGCMRRDVMPER